jgi:hypothetical protein
MQDDGAVGGLLSDRRLGSSSTPTDTIAGKSAEHVVLKCMREHGGGMPLLTKGDRARVKKVLDLFSAFATTEETARLKNKATTEIDAKKLVQSLHDLVCYRLRAQFTSAGKKIPPSLAEHSIATGIGAGAIESRTKTLRSFGCDLAIDRVAFAAFRKEHGPRLLRLREAKVLMSRKRKK